MMRARRALFALFLGALPCVATAFAACDSDPLPEPNPEPRPDPDPGGTYGAEIHVRVMGHGRVKDSIGDLNCPTGCYVRYVYRDRATAGATDRVTLTAEPATGSRFAGWTFEPTVLGTRAKGPDLCSPMRRPATIPQVDLASPAIGLALGELQGTPPQGREVECASHLAVPSAYVATASFIDTDGGDAGDGGSAEVFLEPPVLGFEGKEIGIYATGGAFGDTAVYWRLDQGSTTTIARAIVTATTKTVTSVANVNAQSIVAFDMGPLVAWQNADGTMGSIRASSIATSAVTFSSGGTTCRALATTFSTIYCRTDDGIVSFEAFGGTKQVVHSGLSPVGSTLATLTATSTLVFADSNGDGGIAIKSVPGSGDGGVPAMETIVASVPRDPKLLAVNASNVFWLESDGTSGRAHLAARVSGSTTFDIGAAPTPGLAYLRLDSNLDTSAFLATSTSPHAILGSTGASASTFRSSLPSVGGIAVAQDFVYWTDKSGRVLRAPR